MAYLELKGIRKSYFLGKEEFPVLKGINLQFELGGIRLDPRGIRGWEVDLDEHHRGAGPQV